MLFSSSVPSPAEWVTDGPLHCPVSRKKVRRSRESGLVVKNTNPPTMRAVISKVRNRINLPRRQKSGGRSQKAHSDSWLLSPDSLLLIALDSAISHTPFWSVRAYVLSCRKYR